MKALSKQEFLNAIALRSQPLEIPGIGTVEVRGLSTLESDEIKKTQNGDGIAIMLKTAQLGLIEPKFSADEIELLGQASPGTIQIISEKIMRLSGIMEDQEGSDDLQKKVGSGS